MHEVSLSFGIKRTSCGSKIQLSNRLMKRQIPNAVTLINLFSGCVGIAAAFENDMGTVFVCLLISLISDMADGALARGLKVVSDIGKELDSLADLVSFGLLPSVLIYQFLFPLSLKDQNLAYLAFIITLFTAIRLARFNLQLNNGVFFGLPSPANAVLVYGLVFVANSNAGWWSDNLGHLWIVLLIILLDSLLLIIPVPFFSLKFKGLSWQENKIRYFFLAVAIIILLWQKIFGIPMVVLFYIVLSLGIFLKKAIWS